MCGICGIASRDSGQIDSAVLRTMCRTMTHRGPDDEGYYIKAGNWHGYAPSQYH